MPRVHLFIAIVDSVVELINVRNIVNSSSILAIMQNMEERCLLMPHNSILYHVVHAKSDRPVA
jgi:hypothetical protein